MELEIFNCTARLHIHVVEAVVVVVGNLGN